MCTLTYLPKLSDNGNYIFTSSRDESPQRSAAKFPVFKKYLNRNIIFPQDPEGGGTWFAMSDDGMAVAIMNGAFESHDHNPPYRMSRGLVALEAMECIKADEFIKNYNFEGIEPFTMLILHHNPELELIEFRWDGSKKHEARLDTKKPHIWSSAQLYTKPQAELREGWFKAWLEQNPNYTTKAIRKFHHEAGMEDPNTAVKLDRTLVKTVSITTARVNTKNSDFIYDSLNGKGEKCITISQEIDLQLSL